MVVMAGAPAFAGGGTASETHGESSETRGEGPAEINPRAQPVTTVAAVSPPDAPVPKKVRTIDKKFVAVMAALGGAESLRFSTHTLVLDHEFAEGAPWVTSLPKNRHLVAGYGAIFAAELLVAYELKKSHRWLPGDRIIRKMWWVYPAVMTPIHIKNGIGSIRTHGPSGCTSVAECEAEQAQ